MIGRLRIDRRNSLPRDEVKDRDIQNLCGLNGACSQKMPAAAQAVVIPISHVNRRMLLGAFCCHENRSFGLQQEGRLVFPAGAGYQQVFNTQAKTNQSD